MAKGFTAVVDYGMGNLRSVQKALEKIGSRAIIANTPGQISDASSVILPGVGAFAKCMNNLEKLSLVDSIYRAIEAGKPFLGICLGLQILFTESEEFGNPGGLDIIKGRVIRLPANLPVEDSNNPEQRARLKVPHMGWNSLKFRKRAPVYEHIDNASYFYFVHSFYVVPEDENIISTTTTHGIEFTSSIWKDNIIAMQFHPEKSQKLGLQILKNFSKLK
ncbi:MAG: imidazole glycerol phosphate synthase subunit HisH [Thermodesulfobacteriota bacterium]